MGVAGDVKDLRRKTVSGHENLNSQQIRIWKRFCETDELISRRLADEFHLLQIYVKTLCSIETLLQIRQCRAGAEHKLYIRLQQNYASRFAHYGTPAAPPLPPPGPPPPPL